MGKLIKAIKDNKLSEVKAIIKSGVDLTALSIKVMDPDYWTALHWAVWRNNIEMVDILIRAGAKVNAITLDGKTPLHVSGTYGNIDISMLLISKGADVKARDRYGDTHLHKAERYDHTEYIEKYNGGEK